MNDFSFLSLVFIISDKEFANPLGCSEDSGLWPLAQGLALGVIRRRGDAPGSQLGPLGSRWD